MKVLFLLPIFKNTGPSNVVAAMISQWLKDAQNKQTIELFLVSFNPCQDGYENKFPAEQIKLIQLPGFSFKSLWQLRQFIGRENIDIVHSHCLLPDVAAPLVTLGHKAKTVATVHCNLRDNYRNEYCFPKGPLYYVIHRIALMMINRCVSVSTSAQLTSTTPIIYNGIAAKKLTLLGSDKLNIIFAGRLIESKNIRLLIAGFNRLATQLKKPCQLHIFGDGEMMPALKTEIKTQEQRAEHEQPNKNNQSSIVLHGFVSDYLSHIPENSIVVNPSLFEGMPMAVIEAIGANLPVVLSDISAHQEIAQHITAGIKLHHNSAHSFADAVLTLLDDKEQVSFEQPLMAAQFNQHFADHVMVNKYLAIYQTLL
ncbi:MAG: glycosyltransferase family 4 protein [Thalassotalea sp.]